MAGHRALAAAGRSIVDLLNRRFTELLPAPARRPTAVLAGTVDFDEVNSSATAVIRYPAISVYCYRVCVDRETRPGWSAVGGRIIDAGTIEQAHTSAARAWLADTLAGHESLLIVDTNEQADRLCAQLRADLARLDRVHEHGVPLNLQGTIAGRGDLVQARLNGWDLAGYEGNRRGPINRETYRVLDIHDDDGGLTVAPILSRTADGEQLGEPMVLPGTYVSQHVALGYASTVHARKAAPSTPATRLPPHRPAAQPSTRN